VGAVVPCSVDIVMRAEQRAAQASRAGAHILVDMIADGKSFGGCILWRIRFVLIVRRKGVRHWPSMSTTSSS